MEEHAQEKVEALVRLFQEHHLEELLLEEGDFKLHLHRGTEIRPAAPAPSPTAPPADPPAARHAAPLMEDIQNTVAVRAPLIGVFYRSASPESPPLVTVGDAVQEGQTVCIIEAMKVFNEIKSDWAGRVKEIPAQNGALVQPGDPLVVLEFVDGR